MSAKHKLDTKAFANHKRKRRQWLTFVRMCRYGINNFSRNSWLTIAATAVMTITLLIVFMTLSARQVLVDTVDQIADKVDMSIYLKNETSTEEANNIKDQLSQLSSVRQVVFVSSEQARADNASTNKDNIDVLNAINEATNKLPSTLRVNIEDINDTSQLDDFVKNNKDLQAHIDPNRPPSFAGERRDAIQNLGRWVGFAEKVGLAASALFVAISSLIVFNTIRMAIFNRKEEIQMMKLIGADRNFIRGPFVVEAVVYGFIAAIIATGLGILMLYSQIEKLLSYGIIIQPTVDFVTGYFAFVLLAMILLGATIGVLSSLFATRKYLKI